MLEIKVITVKKAKADIQDVKTKSRKIRRKSPIIEEYEGYLNKLERRKAIEFTLKEGDKYQTIKYRLNNAAKSLGIKNLKIERAGNKVIFYKEVRPRTRKIVPHKAEVSPPQDETQQEQYLYEFEYQPELETGTRPPDADAIQSTFAPASTQDLAHTRNTLAIVSMLSAINLLSRRSKSWHWAISHRSGSNSTAFSARGNSKRFGKPAITGFLTWSRRSGYTISAEDLNRRSKHRSNWILTYPLNPKFRID